MNSMMHVPMVRFTQQDAIVGTGFAIINPVPTMVRLAHSWWPVAARESAPAVSGHERSADGQWNGPHSPADVEGLGFPTQNNRNDLRVTRPPPSSAALISVP